MEEKMQRQRFERKYFISERQALELREFVKQRLVPDEYSAGKPDYSYAVHSIYLDSPQLLTYWATVHCEKKRFKIRVRYYDDDPKSPLFFEIKRRENECVLKQRAIVHRDAGPLLLAGQMPSPDWLVKKAPKDLAALQRFSHLMQKLHARPSVHVGYMREAWMSPASNSVRVTFDRFVRGQVRREPVFTTHMESPILPFGQKRILELKFTDRFPDWFQHLIQHFNLTQVGVPKYCGSVMESGDHAMTHGLPQEMKQKLAQVIRYC